MGRIANLGPTERSYPAEYDDGTRRADFARAEVAHQLAEQIIGSRVYYGPGDELLAADKEEKSGTALTGSPELVAQRVRQLACAQRTRDRYVIRAALMDLATAVGAAIVAIDVSLPNADAGIINGHHEMR